MTSISNPICVPLDTPDLSRAVELASALNGHVGYAKIGLEFFYAHGASGYEAVAHAGLPIFLDLKLHDIPNTVAAGLTSLLRLDPVPSIINVHATGGPDMMRAAADAVAGRVRLIGVTILTSLSDADLAAAGFAPDKGTAEHATRLAQLARECGLAGVVCSAHDTAGIKQACGADFLTVVPGIRPTGSAVQDQKRIATPRAACDAGADILVIGRPITQADDPVAAAIAILEELGAA
ncbi:MAG: orotidine-5'-phosphate decarboxylase [Hyphomicrobiales bacterium]|nr:orotidine-5'-phosphate decarboxylase [Hyphomicrobiales bacterium]